MGGSLVSRVNPEVSLLSQLLLTKRKRSLGLGVMLEDLICQTLFVEPRACLEEYRFQDCRVDN